MLNCCSSEENTASNSCPPSLKLKGFPCSRSLALAMAIPERLSAMESSDSESLQSSALLLLPSNKFSQQHGSPLPHNSAALLPILSSCYLKPRSLGGTSASPPMLRMRAFFSSSPSPSTKPPEVQNFKLPPPVNPPDPENPDRATLRAQWDSAVRLYGRMYSHAWGTAILAGVSLYGIGWWIKGENPLKGLSPTGEIKKEETAD